jgi:hypothetical protein
MVPVIAATDDADLLRTDVTWQNDDGSPAESAEGFSPLALASTRARATAQDVRRRVPSAWLGRVAEWTVIGSEDGVTIELPDASAMLVPWSNEQQ